ncbi:MAG: hypothetical protein HYW05_01940 [Candidatus Diapherotrites archaeon]|nr:hypothetical protein [Candidatus Diapherotrites archaeon]
MDSLTPNIRVPVSLSAPGKNAISNAVLYLSNAAYLPERQEVVIEFSNRAQKITRPFYFLPCMHVNPNGSRELLIELLSAYENKKIKFGECGNKIIRITAATFADLQKAAVMLQSTLQLSPVIISPERQFLLQMGWSYFDAFVFPSNEPEKIEVPSIPNVKFEFLHDSTRRIFSSMLNEEKAVASGLAEALVKSNMLTLPINALPETKQEIAEAWLEKIFFKHGFALSEAHIPKAPFAESRQKGFHSKDALMEVNFSEVWPLLITKSFFNLGFETLNCACCAPENLQSGNLFPNSPVNVKFLAHANYFESISESFALNYHISNPNRDSRIARMQEFCLQAIPVGPTTKDREMLIPLHDAKQLQDEKSAQIMPSGHKLLWGCRKKESFLSLEISELHKKIAGLEALIAEIEKRHSEKFGLNCFAELEKNEKYNYALQKLSCLKALFTYLPRHLGCRSSRFYSETIADSLQAIEKSVMLGFREFTSAQGIRCFAFRNKAFIEGKEALAIAKGFSGLASLPEPSIGKRHDF